MRKTGKKEDIYRRLAKHLDDLPAGFPATKSGVEIRILRRLFTEEEAGMAILKASPGPSPLRVVEEECRRLPAKGWAALIRKVYEVDPMTCPDSETS